MVLLIAAAFVVYVTGQAGYTVWAKRQNPNWSRAACVLYSLGWPYTAVNQAVALGRHFVLGRP